MTAAAPAQIVRRLVVLLVTLTLGLTAAPAVADQGVASPVASISYADDLRVGTALHAELDGSAPGEGSTYRWFADGAEQPETDSVLTVASAHIGSTLTVEITPPADAAPSSEVFLSAATPRVLGTAVPIISGTAVEGHTLTALPGTWTSGTTHAYRWIVDGETAPGATSATFDLTSAHVGSTVEVAVRGSLDGYSSVTEVSKATERVQSKASPSVAGTLLVGATLTATNGRWAPGTTFSYRWYADGQVIAGATSQTLRLSARQGTRRIQVQVTGRNDGFPLITATSASTARVVTAATAPLVSGVAAKGRTLIAKRGTWMKGMTVRYRWYADGVAIAGATRSKLVIPSSAVGKRITVRTTGSRSGYGTVTRASGATRYVQRVGKATLSGSTVATRRMRVSTGTWTSGTRFTYSWTLNGKKISGAKGSSVYVRPSWKGKRLRATVRGTKAGYSTFTSTTSSSAKVSLPGRTDPVSSWNCPSWAPIKGNESSMIYHMPHQRYYKATKPEDCFSTQAAARRAGYRKAKV
ncbi:sunset domain-containing protein [Aeromicrobium sp.]|uniref:sunset domain-containing protein n=1 Tax=Aeromicrobium sp. TaxID=1871063 RepID=UPI004033AD8B